MNIVIAVDSFKGSLSSMEAGTVIKNAVRKVMPDASVRVCPLADGGEGTVEALTLGMGGVLETITVTGPLGTPVECVYGILENRRTAIIEMSGAAGITLVPAQDRNPLNTTTYGVGEILKDAVSKKCRHFIIGIGGSATNDGGAGMLQALGYGMLDQNGNQIPLGAKGLQKLCTITDDSVLPALRECSFQIACDVTNTLCGAQGCSAVFGPQKGADAAMIAQMDQWLAQYAALTAQKYPHADANQAGTGAAGGLGFAFVSYMNAVLEPGVNIVLKETSLENDIRIADLVVTGEGRLDGQTILGKAPIGVAGIAKKYGKKVIAFSGCAAEDAALCNQHGIDAFFPVLQDIQTRQEAMLPENAAKNLSATAEQVFRLIRLF